MMKVALKQPVKIEWVDEEIITLAGCDLGFIMPGKPPQVLQVEQGSEMAAHGLRTDDALVGVDGHDVRNAAKEELEKVLRTATSLTFERPKADGDVDMTPPKGDLIDRLDAPVKEVAPESAVSQSSEPVVATQPEKPTPQPAQQAAPAASEPGGVQLRAGMRVRLVGFQSTAMNGAKGRLGKFSAKQGLWQVFLETTSASKAVRPLNLELLAEDPDRVDAGPARSGDVEMPGAGDSKSVIMNGVPPDLQSTVVAAVAAALQGVVPAPTLPHFDGPGPPPGPEWQEDVLPVEDDKESWVELMRDGCVRQLRSDAEHPEPPPFHRANHFSGITLPGHPLPEGKFPAQALNFQLQMLLRARGGDYPAPAAGPTPYSHGHSNYWSPGRRWAGYGKGAPGWGAGGGFAGMARGPARWMPVAPGPSGAAGQPNGPAQ